MSFLAPLFLFGAAALALPLIFHLIRRTSKERVPFSSLMFLQPTPPRVTRKITLPLVTANLIAGTILGKKMRQLFHAR